ncbi:hypothetical protein [Butyricicoccus porcorum]|uniref:hypothetical protein n=1 Tax=Butyricicoccus porcorum TaxID=1945634 RepID=UPI003F4A8C49
MRHGENAGDYRGRRHDGSTQVHRLIYSAHCAQHKFTVYKKYKFGIITEKGGNNTKNINVNVQRPPINIPLGRQGENRATCVIFDCTGLVQLYGDGTAELLHELKDGTVYPVAVTQDGASVSWTVSASDTATVGAGRAELRWYVGDTLAKSAKFRTSVSSALADTSVSTPPAPQQSWVDKVLAAAQEIKDGAISDEKLAAAIAAYLEEHPIDAGLDEAELAAYLVENGYLTDAALADAIAQALAEAKASGQFDGAPGKDGANGSPGADGVDGVGIESVVQTTTSTDDGGTNIVTVTKTDGSTSTFEVRNGSKGSDGADGQPGADGKSAYAYAVEGGYTGTEAEFAAKLAAEKFANPNALTFTGAVTGSYDGSAPVSVKIPEGGSGEAWELIDSVTLSEDVTAVNFDFDTPYKKILFMCQPNVGVSGWKHLSINKGYWIPCANVAISSTYALFIEIGASEKRRYQAKDNRVFARVRATVEQISMPQNGTLDTYDGNLWVDVASDYFGKKSAVEINSIAMETGGMCVAGAYFEVWGVKA